MDVQNGYPLWHIVLASNHRSLALMTRSLLAMLLCWPSTYSWIVNPHYSNKASLWNKLIVKTIVRRCSVSFEIKISRLICCAIFPACLSPENQKKTFRGPKSNTNTFHSVEQLHYIIIFDLKVAVTDWNWFPMLCHECDFIIHNRFMCIFQGCMCVP